MARTGERHILRLTGNFQLGIPPHNGHMEFVAEQMHILIQAAKQRGGLFHSFDVNPLLRHVFESLPKVLSRLPGTRRREAPCRLKREPGCGNCVVFTVF